MGPLIFLLYHYYRVGGPPKLFWVGGIILSNMKFKGPTFSPGSHTNGRGERRIVS